MAEKQAYPGQWQGLPVMFHPPGTGQVHLVAQDGTVIAMSIGTLRGSNILEEVCLAQGGSAMVSCEEAEWRAMSILARGLEIWGLGPFTNGASNVRSGLLYTPAAKMTHAFVGYSMLNLQPVFTTKPGAKSALNEANLGDNFRGTEFRITILHHGISMSGPMQ